MFNAQGTRWEREFIALIEMADLIPPVAIPMAPVQATTTTTTITTTTQATTTPPPATSGNLRCLHIAMIVFGCIHVVVGIVNLMGANIVGLLFALATGILGIVAGAMVNPCGCCSDPASGTVKCVAIMSIINSVIHVAEMGFTIWYIALVAGACNSAARGCGSLGDAIVGILVASFIWIFISFVICAAGAVVAWREASKMSAAPQAAPSNV